MLENSLARAAALERAGRLAEAAALCRDAVRSAPGDARAWSFLGRLLLNLGQWREAAASYEAALWLAPDDVESLANYGVALAEQDAFEPAVAAYQRAVWIAPDHAVALFNLGNALRALRRYAEAVASYAGAARLRPDWVEAHSNLGLAHALAGRTDAALGSYGRALALAPADADAHNGIALVHQARGELDRAAAHFDAAVAAAPDSPHAHANRAQLALLRGDFARGWPEYEWRWRLPGVALPPTGRPRWDGGPLAGRTILLRAEQGIGDTLQFVRFARLVRARGGRVIVEVQAPLARLFARLPGADAVVARESPLPPHDVEAPLLSLPGLLGVTAATIPGEVPYLAAERALVESWRAELARERAFTVGIAWQGNPVYPQDCHRSTGLARFAPLAAVSGVRLCSLQKGFGAEQLRDADFPMLDLGARLDEGTAAFVDTAAAVGALDLVITADTAIAHLAGALGRPVWVALALVPDWRWLLERETCPWYPSMRLYRQRQLGDWEEVFARIARDLAELARARRGWRPESEAH